MKINSSFPHPILGVNKGVLPDLDDNSLKVVDISERDDYFVYKFELFHQNAQINRYISEGHAEYICEIDCSKSFYKSTVHSKETSIVVELRKDRVIGHVDFSFFIVTTIGMPSYTNIGFNKDYINPETGKYPTFSLSKGDILAIFPQWSDNTYTRFDNKPTLSAFIQVVKRRDSECDVSFNLENDIINIELPLDMFSDFKMYNTNTYRGLLYTSLIFNALVYAILNIKDKTYTWADSIKAIMESMPDKYNGLDLYEPTDAVEIATKMLSNQKYGTPYELRFRCIKSLQD